MVDPDGQEIIGAIIGAVVGAYVGGAMANMSFDPSKWNYNSVGTWTGMIGGAFSGGTMGSGLENSWYASQVEKGTVQSAYGAKAALAAKGGAKDINSGANGLRNKNITKAYSLGGQDPMESVVKTVQ